MTTTSPVNITKQYNITEYEKITNAGFICNLSQETLDIISKLSEMFHPDRAGNYTGILNQEFVEEIIKKSL